MKRDARFVLAEADEAPIMAWGVRSVKGAIPCLFWSRADAEREAEDCEHLVRVEVRVIKAPRIK